MVEFDAFDALTFDVYGTLIDWETGHRPRRFGAAGRHGAEEDDELLEAFARHEAELEAGPYLTTATCSPNLAAGDAWVRASDVELRPSQAPSATGRRSRTPPTLSPRCSRRYRLGVITNCDDDLFALSNRRLGVEFDWVITAQQARGYKPRRENFEYAFERIDVPRERILHVAQSLFHDHAPAKALGMTTVWIDRRHGREGFGATPPAEAAPDLTLPDLRTLARLARQPSA